MTATGTETRNDLSATATENSTAPKSGGNRAIDLTGWCLKSDRRVVDPYRYYGQRKRLVKRSAA